MDSHRNTAYIVGVYFNLCEKIPAVNKAESIHFSVMFCCIWSFQCKKWIEDMTTCPATAINRLNSFRKSFRLYMTFSCPGTLEMHHFIIIIWEIDRHTHYLI